MKSFYQGIADEISLYANEKYTKELKEQLDIEEEMHKRESMAGVLEGIQLARGVIDAMLEKAREELG